MYSFLFWLQVKPFYFAYIFHIFLYNGFFFHLIVNSTVKVWRGYWKLLENLLLITISLFATRKSIFLCIFLNEKFCLLLLSLGLFHRPKSLSTEIDCNNWIVDLRLTAHIFRKHFCLFHNLNLLFCFFFVINFV